MEAVDKMDSMCRQLLRLVSSIGLVFALASHSLTVNAEDELKFNQVEEINRLIHNYLMEHPEVILDSVQRLREREAAAGNEQGSRNLVTFRAQLENDPSTPVVGNLGGDITITEFFDYMCGYCKSTLSTIHQLLAEDTGVRLVLKEFPILSAESAIAARAALAADRQGKYFVFHSALMGARGSLDAEQIMIIAADIGLDTERLSVDMETPQVRAQVDANRELAANLNIKGTPTFVIGDQILPGAIDIEALRQIIEMMRSG